SECASRNAPPRTPRLAHAWACPMFLSACYGGRGPASLSCPVSLDEVHGMPRRKGAIMKVDDATRTDLEAAVYRRLVEHLRTHTEVQNIDLMNLAKFCRNCLSNWMKEAADAKGVPMTKEESRELVYGMPYEEWRAKYQRETSAEQRAAFDAAGHKH